MRKLLLALELALMVLTTISCQGGKVKTGESAGVATHQSSAREPATESAATASPKLLTGELTGKVTEVDPGAKLFTVMVQGRAITFSAVKLSKLPTTGETIDITFTFEPGGVPMATSIALNTSGTARQKVHHCRGWGPPMESLNLIKCG
jgi:hypothetical protein